MQTDPLKQPQRLWPRWLIAGTKPVRVDLGPAGAGVLVDVGGGGIRVQSLAPLKRGAEVPVRMDIPDKYEAIQCSGIVVWSKPNGAAGIRFTSITETQKTNLRSWLDDLERAATSPHDPQQYDEFTATVSKIRAGQLNNADALNFILNRVSEATSASGAAIALGTPENMVCLAAVGIAPEVGSQIPPGKGLTSEAVLRRKMVHCQNTRNDPRIGPNAKFASAVILPLIVSGEVRGTLEAFSPRTYAFDTSAIDVLEKLADAVVFVTYGIVTQRRLAAAKSPAPQTPPTASPTIAAGKSVAEPASISKPVAPPARTPSFRAEVPVSPAHSASALSNSIAQPQASVAPTPSTPTFAPSQSKVVITTGSHVRTSDVSQRPPRPAAPKPTPLPKFLEQPQTQPSSSGKWILGLLVLLLMAAVPLWFFVLRPKAIVSSQAPAPASPPVSKPLQIETPPITVSATLPAEPAAPANVDAMPVNTSPTIIPKPASPVPSKATVLTQKSEKKVEEARKTEPIILSASTGPRRGKIDTAPIAAPVPIASGGSLSMVPMAAPTAAPKLASEAISRRTGGNLIKRIAPIYPQQARAMGIQGQVELHLEISTEGTVSQVKRISGNAILMEAAADAVKRWRYEPLKLNGNPVDFETNVILKFDLAH